MNAISLRFRFWRQQNFRREPKKQFLTRLRNGDVQILNGTNWNPQWKRNKNMSQAFVIWDKVLQAKLWQKMELKSIDRCCSGLSLLWLILMKRNSLQTMSRAAVVHSTHDTDNNDCIAKSELWKLSSLDACETISYVRRLLFVWLKIKSGDYINSSSIFCIWRFQEQKLVIEATRGTVCENCPKSKKKSNISTVLVRYERCRSTHSETYENYDSQYVIFGWYHSKWMSNIDERTSLWLYWIEFFFSPYEKQNVNMIVKHNAKCRLPFWI